MLSARLVHFVVRASAQPLCPRRLYGFRLNLPKRRGAADAEAAQRHETEPAAPIRRCVEMAPPSVEPLFNNAAAPPNFALRLTRLELNLYIRVLGRSGSRSIAVVCSVTLSTDPANH